MTHDPQIRLADVPFEEIEGLTISPQTDLPFGKPLQMGLTVYTIYDTAVEKGYHAGISTHRELLTDHHTTTPVLLDDAQFRLVMDTEMPQGLTEHAAGLWRAAFIAGWASVYLGLLKAIEK